MGRPLNKRFFYRTEIGGDDTVTDDPRFAPKNDTAYNITAIVKVGANSVSETGILLSQRSETKFKVNDVATGTNTALGSTGAQGNVGICQLVDKDVPADNEMVVKGYVAGSGDGVNIRKFHNRTVIDFDNNRYTWETQDDSTANIIVLTAI